jgi:hypothetical protein
MSLHLELGTLVERTFAGQLAGPVEQTQDALIVRLPDDVTLIVRYAAPDAYSLRWTHGNTEAGIDTAPMHRELPTFPNHLHDSTGRARADPVTDPERPPEDNLVRLIRALLDDPALGSTTAS